MTVAASPKLGAYMGLVGIGLLASLVIQRPEPLALAAPFLLALLVGLARAEAPRIAIQSSLERSRALEREVVDLSLELEVTTAVPWLEVLVWLPPGLAHPDAAVRRLGLQAGERWRLHEPVRCARWGGYALGRVLVRAHDAWGFFTFEQEWSQRLPLRVYPQPEAVSRALRPAETQVYTGNEVSRAKGDGIEFADVRPFAPGDRVRRINWRISSRQRALFVNELHPERNADVVLFLDTFIELRDRERSSLGLMVRAAAALAERYLQRRDRVGLVGFGGILRWLTPSMGVVQRYRILEALLDTNVVLSYAWKGIEVIPPRTLPPKALVVALTPLLDDRAVHALLDLRARGFDLAVVEVSPLPFVAPGSGEGEQLAYRIWQLERDRLRLQYQRLGVPVAAWRAGEPLEAALGEVRGFQRFARFVRA